MLLFEPIEVPPIHVRLHFQRAQGRAHHQLTLWRQSARSHLEHLRNRLANERHAAFAQQQVGIRFAQVYQLFAALADWDAVDQEKRLVNGGDVAKGKWFRNRSDSFREG